MANYQKLAAGAHTDKSPTKKPSGLRPPWVKGQSGNPKGRPSQKPITDMFKRILSDPESVAAIEANVTATLRAKGMAGVILINHIADRVEGKVADELTITDLRDLDDDELEARRKKLDNSNS